MTKETSLTHFGFIIVEIYKSNDYLTLIIHKENGKQIRVKVPMESYRIRETIIDRIINKFIF